MRTGNAATGGSDPDKTFGRIDRQKVGSSRPICPFLHGNFRRGGGWKTLQNEFRGPSVMCRQPSREPLARVDAKCGDHFLLADFPGLIRTVEVEYPLVRPITESLCRMATQIKAGTRLLLRIARFSSTRIASAWQLAGLVLSLPIILALSKRFTFLLFLRQLGGRLKGPRSFRLW